MSIMRAGGVLLVLAGAALAAAAEVPSEGCFPLLSPGVHVTSGYSDPRNSSALASARQHWSGVLGAGTIDTWHVGLTWAQLEPYPGEINVSYVADIMQTLHRVGYRPMVGLHVLDGAAVTVPRDLLAEGGSDSGSADSSSTAGSALRAGLAWDSEELATRYQRMLKVVVPLVAYYGAFHINVGADVDVALAGEGGAAFARFLGASRAFIQDISTPLMSVGATVTFAGAKAAAVSGAKWLPDLQAAASVTPLSYVPLAQGGAFRPALPTSPLFDVPLMLSTLLPPEMCLALQGFGFPSAAPAAPGGRAGSTPSAGHGAPTGTVLAPVSLGEGNQAKFVASLFNVLATALEVHPGRLRFVGGGQFVDRPEAVCAFLAARQGLTGAARDAFLRHECSLGLLYPDGSAKPAFWEFLTGMKALTPPPPTQDVWR